ncbi:MAG: TldD/PmbA family protein [Thiotrichales bacterium]
MDLERLLESIDVPADWVGLRYVDESSTYRAARDEHPEANTRDRSRGVMVEVLVDGQFAYASTPKLTTQAVASAAHQAFTLAKSAAPYAVFSFSEQVRPPSKGQYRSAREQPGSAISAGEINELLIKATERLKVSELVVSTEASAEITNSRQHYLSSNGADFSQDFLIISTDFSAVAQNGSVVQRRSDAGSQACSWQIGVEIFNEDDILTRCEKTGAEAVELLSAEECPSDTRDLLLAPDQIMLQIHESIGHPLELDRILGDERNYAGWSFVRPGDFGKLQYGSSLMNITFDPTVPHELASYAFDDGGAIAEKAYLIKDGVLQRGLGGLESQARSGLPGVANFRACDWNRAPIDRMANINLEPGDATLEEMIASVEKGIYMQSNRSWSIDDYRNKFQFGCEYAQLIENGRLTRTVRNPNYRGISSHFWKSLKAVGNRDSFEVYGTPNCGKGEPNQVIRVGHASPPSLFSSVEIFGGAE